MIQKGQKMSDNTSHLLDYKQPLPFSLVHDASPEKNVEKLMQACCAEL